MTAVVVAPNVSVVLPNVSVELASRAWASVPVVMLLALREVMPDPLPLITPEMLAFAVTFKLPVTFALAPTDNTLPIEALLALRFEVTSSKVTDRFPVAALKEILALAPNARLPVPLLLTNTG